MTRQWTAARARAVDQIADERGVIVGVAADHRDAMYAAFAERGLPAPTAEQVTDLKLRIARCLAPRASTILLDAEHSAAQALAEGAVPGSTALVVPLEAQGYLGGDEGDDLRLTSFLPDWGPGDVAALGGAGCKLLLPFRPDIEAQAEHQERVAQEARDRCHEAGVALVLEPIVFARPGETLAAEERGELIVETARRLAQLGPDILKVQYPGSAELCRQLDEAATPQVPWVLLGGGADHESLERQIAEACVAGASGFIVGRTLFAPGIVADSEQSERALRSESLPMLERLAAVAEERAQPWRSRVGAIERPPLDWYRAGGQGD